MNELSNKTETNLPQSPFNSIVKIANDVGEQMGKSLSKFIDKCFGVEER